MTFPIILAHGVCRFDILINEALKLDNNDDPKLDRLHYFRGIRTMLMAKGFCVYHSNVSWAADVNTRAEDLRINIEDVLKKEKAKKVNIIAHSMGGLVSVKSATWRDRYFKKEIDKTDHLNELGWWEPAQLYSGEGDSELLKRIHKLYFEIAQGLP